MKKRSILFGMCSIFCLVIGMAFASCNLFTKKTEESTLITKQEWDSLFTLELFDNITMSGSLEKPTKDNEVQNIKLIVKVDGDTSYQYAEQDPAFEAYYVKEGDSYTTYQKGVSETSWHIYENYSFAFNEELFSAFLPLVSDYNSFTYNRTNQMYEVRDVYIFMDDTLVEFDCVRLKFNQGDFVYFDFDFQETFCVEDGIKMSRLSMAVSKIDSTSIQLPLSNTYPFKFREIYDYSLQNRSYAVSVFDESIEEEVENKYDDITFSKDGYCEFILSQQAQEKVDAIGDKLIIPSTYNGLPVTRIDAYAFAYCNFETVQIPDTIIEIGEGAFFRCTRLKHVDIPASVADLEGAMYGGDNEGVFEACFSLLSVNFNSNSRLRRITANTFKGCMQLSEIIIPDSVEAIARDSFMECCQLTKVTLGASLEDIYMAFDYCNKVVEIYNKSALNIVAGVPYKMSGLGETALNVYTPQSGQSIISRDVNGFITYADGTERVLIGYDGDEKAITIPNTITKIYTEAFSSKVAITSITLSDSVTSIGEAAFKYCDNLTDVFISKNVTFIEKNVFDSCCRLTNIQVAPENKTYQSIDGNLYTKDGKILLKYAEGKTAKSFTVPFGVDVIGEEAFRACANLTNVVLCETIIDIGCWAFAYCNLINIEIPDSVVTIGSNAFFYSGLQTITFGANSQLTSIGADAFTYCMFLTSVTIPNSVTTIGSDAFYDCYGLTNVYYQGTKEDWEQLQPENHSSVFDDCTLYYYVENQSDVPVDNEKYWHYDENGDIVVW